MSAPPECICPENDCLYSQCPSCRIVDQAEEPPPCITDPDLLSAWGDDWVIE